MNRAGLEYLLACSALSALAYASEVRGQVCPDRLPAFPGAEGFGKYSRGGRGGVVVEVTNLNDSGPGSLRDALTRPLSQPRTVVFRVGGAIVLESHLETSQSFITIAGETAPGDGVYIHGADIGFTDCEHIIIRDLTVRTGCAEGRIENLDAIGFARCRNVILDSVSASFAVDENISFVDCDEVTVQWSITSYGLRGGDRSCHTGSRSDHSCAMLLVNRLPGLNRISILHNLFSNTTLRTPLVTNQGGGVFQVELIGNAIYNWGQSGETGTGYQLECQATPTARIDVNYLANFYRYGPETGSDNVAIRISNNKYGSVCDPGVGDYFSQISIYRSGNRFQTATGLVSDLSGPQFVSTWPRTGFSFSTLPAFDPAYIPQDGLGEYVAAISERAGAGGSLITRGRDEIDTRAVWTFLLHQPGSIEHQDDILEDIDGDGSPDWPVFRAGTAPADADHDGMSDAWELANGFDPAVADGHLPSAPGGYSRLEVYLQSLRVRRSDPVIVCAADLNCDSLADFADYLEFLNLYDAGAPRVDFNQDGLVDFGDYLEFLNLYEIGC